MTDSNNSGFVPIKPAAVDLTAAASTQQQNSRRPGKQLMMWLGIGTALAVAVMVFYLLPGWVGDPDIGPAGVVTRTGPVEPQRGTSPQSAPPPAGATAATGDAPWRQAQQFSRRKESQEILGELLDAQKMLEERGVSVWGSKEYEQALEHARSGDAEYSRQNFSRAHDHYAQALDVFTGLLQGMEELFAGTMETGHNALAAGDVAAAREAFRIALAIDPIDRTALLGMERAGDPDGGQ